MYTIPADADEACAALAVHLVEMEKSFAVLLASVTKYFEASKKIAACLVEMHVRCVCALLPACPLAPRVALAPGFAALLTGPTVARIVTVTAIVSIPVAAAVASRRRLWRPLRLPQ